MAIGAGALVSPGGGWCSWHQQRKTGKGSKKRREEEEEERGRGSVRLSTRWRRRLLALTRVPPHPLVGSETTDRRHGPLATGSEWVGRWLLRYSRSTRPDGCGKRHFIVRVSPPLPALLLPRPRRHDCAADGPRAARARNGGPGCAAANNLQVELLPATITATNSTAYHRRRDLLCQRAVAAVERRRGIGGAEAGTVDALKTLLEHPRRGQRKTERSGSDLVPSRSPTSALRPPRGCTGWTTRGAPDQDHLGPAAVQDGHLRAPAGC